MDSASINPGSSLQACFQAFHDAHFSQLATDQFLSDFLRPDHTATEQQEQETYSADEEYEEYYEDFPDDGLGYYDDGVKRTLTDEQVAIFRYSELKSLLEAARQQSSNNPYDVSPAADNDTNQNKTDKGELSEEGELSSAPQAATSSKKKKKNNRRKGASYRNAAGELIDLRKRTWDVVDKGLTTLTYDDEMDAPAQSNTAKRQRVSYDD